MDKSISGLRPESLKPGELVRYARLGLDETGLNKEWSEALLKVLERALDDYKVAP